MKKHFPAVQAKIDNLEKLISEGAKFREVRSHPGKTDDFVQWKNDCLTALYEICGGEYPLYKEAVSLIFFPKWYREEIHGPGLKDEPGLTDKPRVKVISDAQSSDAKTAFRIFKSSVVELITKLNAVRRILDEHGKIERITKQSRSSPLISQDIKQEQKGASVGDIHQAQFQTQEQRVNLASLIDCAIKTVEETVDNEKDIEQAKIALKEFKKQALEGKPKWATGKKIAKMFLKFGRDAFISLLPVLLQVYGVIPPTPTTWNSPDIKTA